MKCWQGPGSEFNILKTNEDKAAIFGIVNALAQGNNPANFEPNQICKICLHEKHKRQLRVKYLKNQCR